MILYIIATISLILILRIWWVLDSKIIKLCTINQELKDEIREQDKTITMQRFRIMSLMRKVSEGGENEGK